MSLHEAATYLGVMVAITVLAVLVAIAGFYLVLKRKEISAWWQDRCLLWRARRLSVQSIVECEAFFGEEPQNPELLSRQIVQRARHIRRVLRRNSPASTSSQVEIEMCQLGYSACLDDLIELVHLVEEELPGCGAFRRLKLKIIRWRAQSILLRVRQALPPEAVHATSRH